MKLLYITSLSGRRLNGFMRSAILAARQLNIDVTMACNTDGADTEGYAADCAEYGIKLEHIDFARNPLSLQNKKAYRQLLAIMKREQFDAIHCNTPVGGLLGRLCARRTKIPYVIYQAHGFHFWKGAPLKNWMLYYPVEKLLARYTDLLITINSEDHARAQRFRLKKGGKQALVHGVGVDAHRIENATVDKAAKRAELGIPEDAVLFVTAGELNKNKNQITAIDAFAKADIANAYFIICGDGENRKILQDEIERRNLTNKIILAGFRRDMPEILKASDIFVLPSFREGLPGALMEAMAAGLPCMASRIRGNVDLLGEDYPYLFAAGDSEDLCGKMQKITYETTQWGEYCRERIKPYTLPVVVEELKHIYERIRVK